MWLPIDPLAREVEQAITQTIAIARYPDLFDWQLGRVERSDEVFRHLLSFLGEAPIVDRIGRAPASKDEVKTLLGALAEEQRREILMLVPAYLERELYERQDKSIDYERSALPEPLNTASQTLIRQMVGLRHIGPLRERPRTIYEPSTGVDAQDVGPRGEYTPAVLHALGDRPIVFWRQGELHRETLLEAVDAWLGVLKVHAGARSHWRGKLGHELEIRDADVGGGLDPTQVGVGVSQLLPIVVQLLVMPAGSTLLLEQPELHLHPAVQSRVADLLVAAIRSGRQVICETHSEHLISRLRILTGLATLRYEFDYRIYFATRVHGNTEFQDIEVDSHGRILNWPDGFFDQSARDASELIRLDLSRK
jgi:hypothetical protein